MAMLVTSEHPYRGQGMKRERKKKKFAFDGILFSAVGDRRNPRRAFFSSSYRKTQNLPLLQKNNRCTFVVEGFTYNYVVDGSFTFLAVSAER